MAGGGSSKSRKRVEATPADVAATGPSLVRAKDGSAFARWCVFLLLLLLLPLSIFFLRILVDLHCLSEG